MAPTALRKASIEEYSADPAQILCGFVPFEN